MIIGIYGISGAGKTLFTKEIEGVCPLFNMIDGSVYMNEVIPGGLNAFKKMKYQDKYCYRMKVIKEIDKRYRDLKFDTIVTGHYAFMNTNNEFEIAWTKAEEEVYDVIFYLRKEAKVIYEQRKHDKEKQRSNLNISQLEYWDNYEISNLEKKCDNKGIPLIVLDKKKDENIADFFKAMSQEYIKSQCDRLATFDKKTFVLFDCDGTLFNGDSLDYIDKLNGIERQEVINIFKRREYYCFNSFFEVAQYYSKISIEKFNQFLKSAIKGIQLDDRMLKIVRKNCKHHTVIWITAGFPEIWEEIAHRYKLNVKVIGGNNLARKPIVISNEEKELLVKILHSLGKAVYGYGDSMGDAGMLKLADKAFVVISKKKRRDLLNHLQGHKNLEIIDIRGDVV